MNYESRRRENTQRITLLVLRVINREVLIISIVSNMSLPRESSNEKEFDCMTYSYSIVDDNDLALPQKVQALRLENFPGAISCFKVSWCMHRTEQVKTAIVRLFKHYYSNNEKGSCRRWTLLRWEDLDDSNFTREIFMESSTWKLFRALHIKCPDQGIHPILGRHSAPAGWSAWN